MHFFFSSKIYYSFRYKNSPLNAQLNFKNNILTDTPFCNITVGKIKFGEHICHIKKLRL